MSKTSKVVGKHLCHMSNTRGSLNVESYLWTKLAGNLVLNSFSSPDAWWSSSTVSDSSGCTAAQHIHATRVYLFYLRTIDLRSCSEDLGLMKVVIGLDGVV